ncbi:MAG TPA: hypothetical protein VLV86_09630, partial [Vicinamibacterales bacterium]|nr:hypothetical protein [Vicinamibacterales bacterium]
MRVRAVLVVVALCSCVLAAQSSPPPSPEAFFGFPLGADGKLAGADEIEKYFQTVAAASDRVTLTDI